MIEVVGIKFNNSGTMYYFDPQDRIYEKDCNVIVETEYGLQFGTVIQDNIKIKNEKIVQPLKKIIKKASDEDIKKNDKNLKDATVALDECKNEILKIELNMNVLSCFYTFDRSQLIYYFTSDNRIDFRELVKILAKKFHTRIEMRQIGARDKSKHVGGIGPCGRILCCKKFLNNFDSISIGMAKNQSLALNPNKINGCCGRLFCCLEYEDEQYVDLKKGMPTVGKKVETEYGVGKVVSVDYFKRKYNVEIDNTTYEIECE